MAGDPLQNIDQVAVQVDRVQAAVYSPPTDSADEPDFDRVMDLVTGSLI
jgi:hypothetical protein